VLNALAGAQAQPEPTPLFDGRSLAGWAIENGASSSFLVSDGVLRVTGPAGWLRSQEQYGDFVLDVEFRFLTDDADSGIFVRAPGPASNVFVRGWPANAYQVQARDISTNRSTNPIWIGNLYRHRVAPGPTEFDADAASTAARPTGAWQAFTIQAVGDHLDVTLNGVLVTRASGIENPRGFIGIQAETGVVEYRAIGSRRVQ